MSIRSRLFNLISTISCIIMVVFLYAFIIITDSYYFNGYIVLIFLSLLLNPVANIFKLNKKIITNPIYHLLIVGLSSYISYISIKSIQIYFQYLKDPIDNSLSHNLSVNYFGDRFIYIAGATILILLLGLLLKKQNIKKERDYSKLMLTIILLSSFIPIIAGDIWCMNLITAGFGIAEIVFIIIIFFKLRNINTASELQRYYLILIICSIISINPVALVLSIYMFIQLDTFGLNI